MVSSLGWQLHGCYSVGSTQYDDSVSFEPAASGCHDDETSKDYFNYAHPTRNALKVMHYLRQEYRTLKDAITFTILGNYSCIIEHIGAKGINGYSNYRGLWSAQRLPDYQSQDFGSAEANQTIWFLYSNDNITRIFESDCSASVKPIPPYSSIIAPFDQSKKPKIKNLLYPYEEITLSASTLPYNFDGKAPYHGCLPKITMDAYSMKMFVASEFWKDPIPAVVKIVPGHDDRILATASGPKTLDFEMHFSTEMVCTKIIEALSITSITMPESTKSSTTEKQAKFENLACSFVVNAPRLEPSWISPQAAWRIAGKLSNVYDGVHRVQLKGNYTSVAGVSSFNGTESYLFRIGSAENPIVFPRVANFSTTLLSKASDGTLMVNHNAAGADKFSYSLDWQSSWSNWTDITGQNMTISKAGWKGTKSQAWKGEHIVVQYWSSFLHSSMHIQHGDTVPGRTKRWPHVFAQGSWNLYGYDGALNNKFEWIGDEAATGKNYSWKWNMMTEWPANVSLNLWGTNKDGNPDVGFLYGDLDQDGVLDRVPPGLIGTSNLLYFADPPKKPYLSYQIHVSDSTHRWSFVEKGHIWIQVIIFLSLLFVPIALGGLSMLVYAGAFNKVRWNKFGVKATRGGWFKLSNMRSHSDLNNGQDINASSTIAASALSGSKRRRVLIATLEYDIADLKIKIKIGGLGVMAQLMGTNLKHQDLIWVVPMVGDVDYPLHILERGEPYEVAVNGSIYGVDVHYHILDNITYVLLDSPVFAKQTKADPYPPRMDDLESAVFYSAWNQCIAKTCKRFPIDLYHINDYHGALAPLYLLPKVIPCALSLHNAEFQGLWPLRKKEEKSEVCGLFSVTEDVCSKYIQFGNVFNLLHAGVSYLRIHQDGFGAVGVSDKYGARSLARYPIFWSLKEIGKLPNPDPSDTGAVEEGPGKKRIDIDWEAEKKRKEYKREAQQWAGLELDEKAQLLVFVGRWTVQKGIDLIADLAPTLLEEFNVQIITVGPVVDLHGKFAAEKLAVLMEQYPQRVFSKPVFTAVPPAVFSGADFALIPSRDEPFGLVAVEFGRKGALGIGCKVGGLGTMPGWWYTMNSASAAHLLSQFESACRSALKSSEKVRAELRARAAKQRFPVAVWVKRLDSLQSTCMQLSHKHNKQRKLTQPLMEPMQDMNFDIQRPTILEPLNLDTLDRSRSVLHHRSAPVQADYEAESDLTSALPIFNIEDRLHQGHLNRKMSLGSRRGPGGARAVLNQNLLAVTEEEDEDENDSYAVEEEYYGGSEEDFQLAPGREGPVERDIDDYIDEYDHSGAHQREMRMESGARLQADDRFGWPSRVPSSSYESQYTIESSQQSYQPYQTQIYRHSPHSSSSSSDLHREDTLFGQGRSTIRLTHHTPSRPGSPALSDDYLPPPGTRGLLSAGGGAPYLDVSAGSRLSVLSLGDLEKDSPSVQKSTIRKGETVFTDADGQAKAAFITELQKGITANSSKKNLCIETYLVKCEKAFFDKLKDQAIHSRRNRSAASFESLDQIDLESELTKVQRFLANPKLGWPIYTILMAMGQILAANSYQLTLLAGQSSPTAVELYIVNVIFAAMSAFWWYMFRRTPALYVLSIPFAMYGISFIMIGLPYISTFSGTKSAEYITHSASYIYAAASASGSLFFALNFGAEGGIEVKGWVMRACIVQGFQQIWSAALWYWGNGLNSNDNAIAKMFVSGVPLSVAILVWIIGAFLFVVGILMFSGLPKYYRQAPGVIPAFYRSLYRRKIIVWFLFSQILINFWLSLPYGRNWTYLWGSNLPPWVVVLLCAFFFIGIWTGLLLCIRYFTKTHTWAPVIFALGIIAPRYFQEFWAVSTIGFYLPWTGGPVASAIVGRSLWLWLGILDSASGMGIGVLLLQTLIRDHVAFTLICAQIVGAISTIVAKMVDIPFSSYLVSFASWTPSDGVAGPFGKPLFYICFLCQIAVPIGFFLMFRKSQLAFGMPYTQTTS